MTWINVGDGRPERLCRRLHLPLESLGLQQVPRLNMLNSLAPSPPPTLRSSIKEECLLRAARRASAWLRQERAMVERHRRRSRDSEAHRHLDLLARDMAHCSGLIVVERQNCGVLLEATAQVHMT
jgi:hypothetical protein